MVSTFTHVPGLEATVEGRTQLQGAGRPASCCLKPWSPGPKAWTRTLTLGLQVAEQVPQLALLGETLTVTNVLHTDVQAAWVWGAVLGGGSEPEEALSCPAAVPPPTTRVYSTRDR